MEQNKTLKRCKAPWFETILTGSDRITATPCCYLPADKFEINSVDDLDFLTTWNSKNFKLARLVNTNNATERNSTKNNFCANCVYYDTNNNLDLFYHLCNDIEQFVDDDLTQEQKDNYELAMSEYEQGKIELQSTPIFFSAMQGINCNLNCRMCFQRNETPNECDKDKFKDKISAESILKLKPYLKKALWITLIGGDPFAIPEAVKLLKVLVSDPDFKTVRISLWSNAIMIDKYFDLLKQHPKITLFTSPDSLGYTYEYIRRGAKWNKFEANVKEFQKISKENNLKWNVKCHNLLMKSSIDKIGEYASWCVENDIEACFSLLCSIPWKNEFCDQEDVISNPKLLDSVLNWDKKLDRAIEIFEKSGNQNVAVDSLIYYKKQIENAYQNPPKPKSKSKIIREINRFLNRLKNKHKNN